MPRTYHCHLFDTGLRCGYSGPCGTDEEDGGVECLWSMCHETGVFHGMIGRRLFPFPVWVG